MSPPPLSLRTHGLDHSDAPLMPILTVFSTRTVSARERIEVALVETDILFL